MTRPESKNDPFLRRDAVLRTSQMAEFRMFCEKQSNLAFPDHQSFHDFSVREFRTFWWLFLRWSTIAFEGSMEQVCTDDLCEDAVFFPNLRLNYAENLLRIESHEDSERPAITACDKFGVVRRLSRRELRDKVSDLADELCRLRVEPGDRVVAVVRNTAEAVVAALATAAVGAAFSSATPDMGTSAILSRFQQLSPKLVMAHLAATEDSGNDQLTRRIAEIVAGLPSLEGMVALDEGPRPQDFNGAFVRLSALAKDSSAVACRAPWRRFPFNHPLFIMFSSGTTGRPKCIVHGAGGTLIEHIKEHRLHGDLRPMEKLFFQTSTAWMMWNWQLSALGCDAEILLFDGSVSGPETLWHIVAQRGVSVFGTSPPYLKLCETSAYSPRQHSSFPALRAVMSTGSVLEDHQYDWFHRHVGDLPLQSISGGTDIIGCFVLGHPDLPVRRGESQCRSLGMDVQALHEDRTAAPGTIGELVCRNPFPSRPLGFYGDHDGSRFRAAYFSQHPGIWTHGDRIEISVAGGARLHGRSDSTMKVNGIRIGPAEIYRIVHTMPEVQEAMVVEQRTPNAQDSSRMVLLVVPRAKGAIDDPAKTRIRKKLATQASPAHVPALIVEVQELPTTHSGKRSELAVRDALNGSAVPNASALSNPHCLQEICNRVAAEESSPSKLSGDATVAEQLRDIWERILNVRDVNPDDTFFELGGTSLMAVRMCQVISDRLGVTLGPWILFQAPTLRTLTVALGPNAPAHKVSTVVPLKPIGRGHPLFMIPGMFGDIMELRTLTNAIRCERPLYGMRARGLFPGEAPHIRVEDMARDYLQSMRALQPRGPYSLVGYSFGGLVAYEMACLLRKANEEIEFLGLIDADVHDRCLPWPERAAFLLMRPLRYARIVAQSPVAATLDLWRRYFRTRAFAPTTQRNMNDVMSPLLQRVARLNRRAFSSYQPASYDGPLTIFRASERWPRFCDPLPVWRQVATRQISIYEIQGAHTELVQEPGVAALARRLGLIVNAGYWSKAEPHGALAE